MPGNAWRSLAALLAAVMVGGTALTPMTASANRASAATGMSSSVRIYLVAIGDNGISGTKVGCGDSLVAVTRKIEPTRAPLTAAVRMVIRNHHRSYGQSGLYNALYQSRLVLKRAEVVNGTATVHLTGSLRLGGVCDVPRVQAQLRRAALQFPTVQHVFVYVNGVPLSKALSSR